MPWKETKDPYKIWLSEIILQQTQVTQGTSYYLAFVDRFPTVQDLAAASEDEVLRLWQGLGYNTRARNLHATAVSIVRDHEGVFPQDFDTILALPGIGEYTAAAIASFAFGTPKPVLDSNVIRVLARLVGIAEAPAAQTTRRRYYAILEKMIRGVDPAHFNQAIMNFGAMHCRPRNPLCTTCPVAKACVALKHNMVAVLPPPKPRKAHRQRYFHYFVVRDRYGVILRRRTEGDIWKHLYDFPVIESNTSRMPSAAIRRTILGRFGVDDVICNRVEISQTLTHQKIYCVFYEVRAPRVRAAGFVDPYHFELFKNLKTFAFPKAIRTYISHIALL